MKAALVLVFFAAFGQISAQPWLSSIKDSISKGKENLSLDKIKETIDEKKTDMTNQIDSIQENLSLDKIKESIDEKKIELTDQLDSLKELPTEISEAIKNKAEEAQEKAENIVEDMKNMQEEAAEAGEKIQKDVADLLGVEQELNDMANQGSELLQKGKDAVDGAIEKGKDAVDGAVGKLPMNQIWGFWSRVFDWFVPNPAMRAADETAEKWAEINEKSDTESSGGFLSKFWRGSKKE